MSSIGRLKGLQRLEAKQPKGRACWRKLPERTEPLSDEDKAAFDRAVRDADRVADRLSAQRAAAEAERRKAKAERRAARRAEAARVAEAAQEDTMGRQAKARQCQPQRLLFGPAAP